VTELAPEDLSALDDLVLDYAGAVDARDWVVLAELFTEDAELVTPDPPHSLAPVVTSLGRAAIVATVRQVASFSSTSHVVIGSTWTATAAGASGETTGEAHHHVADVPDPHAWVWHVAYHDDCVRTDGGWRIARRALTVRRIEKRPLR
jgi:hypothetical protein